MRINVIEPEFLLDQHLMAEYNEFAMLISSVKRSKASKNGITGIPEVYTLGAGHGKFFYDKRNFIISRYDRLKEELVKRGFNLNPHRVLNFDELMNHGEWTPTNKDNLINLKRIFERFILKKSWYRFYRKPIDPVLWTGFYQNMINQDMMVPKCSEKYFQI